MYYQDEQLYFSPSDITCYFDSPFASWMDRYATEYPSTAPSPDTASMLMERLKQKGLHHEQQVLKDLMTSQASFTHITGSCNKDKLEKTLEAMQQGIPLIVQAYLEHESFSGFADFLVRVEGHSKLGDYHYEVWDAKLSKNIKPSFIIQLCCYTDLLTHMQGKQPKNLTIALGSGKIEPIPIDQHFDHYLVLKQAFLQAQIDFSSDSLDDDAPDPTDSKSWGSWSNFAKNLLLKRDHLLQVANIRRTQIKKLYKHNIHSMTDLANTTLQRIPGINNEVFQRLKLQADIQLKSIGSDKPLFHILPHTPETRMGLALLPPHSTSDLFFDIEGYPLHKDGLEYLWGCTFFNNQGERVFKDFWAHDTEQEKLAFTSFIDWAYQRWKKDPSMHIYHYANYEITACRRLMSRYGYCEYEVDQLLRNEVFVDLYKVVKGGLLLGEPKYSIKNVELLYRSKRATEVESGGDSVAVYEQWRELFDAGEESDHWQSSPILKSIRDYNVDDCDSTQELVDWLRQQQEQHSIQYVGKDNEIIEPKDKDAIDETSEHRKRLLKKSQEFSAESKHQSARVTENLAWTLEFHQRENKPVFWRLFERMGLSEIELADDIDCLAGCTRTQRPPFKPKPRARNLAYEYQFDTQQEFKGVNKDFYLLESQKDDGSFSKVGYVREGSELANGKILLQANQEPPQTLSLIPDEYIRPAPIPQAIRKVTDQIESNGLANGAITDFLNRSKPNISDHQGAIIKNKDSGTSIPELISAVKNLNNSYLTIQGPPGAGKTYTGKHIIAALLKDGAKIGIASNSHKAINNLLLSTAKHCVEQNISAAFACTKETEKTLLEYNIDILANSKLAHFIAAAEEKGLGVVLGTTAWGFARDDLQDQLDYLFIDEAGQVSIANLIGMSQATRNIILLGDQMQLGQPSQSSHPAESGLSVLDYLLHDNPIISEDMGVFLNTSYRMHENVNAFISKYIYQNQLQSHPTNNVQRILPGEKSPPLIKKEAGIVFIPAHHEGNTQSSPEEVKIISTLAHDFLDRIFMTSKGDQRRITWDDMLFVAPYNYQVSKLQQALGTQARVGSIDKFQGQEAPIVCLSMCASDANELSRGLEFLLDKNRLNVAISRAQSLAIIVGNPSIGLAHASNVEQLTLLNLYCSLLKYQIPELETDSLI